MARTSISGSPGLSELGDMLLRDLLDSCRVIRTLSGLPPNPDRMVAIESERVRARRLYSRYIECRDCPAHEALRDAFPFDDMVRMIACPADTRL